jgi:hypothetical protein
MISIVQPAAAAQDLSSYDTTSARASAITAAMITPTVTSPLTITQGNISVAGDAIYTTRILRGSGSGGGTTFRLTEDGLTAGASNCLNIATNSTYLVESQVLFTDNAGNALGYHSGSTFGICLYRTSGNAAINGSAVNTFSVGTTTGGNFAFTADTSNQGLNATCTIPTSNSNAWHGVMFARILQLK